MVSATGNPLYGGRYDLHGRYMTFGQQSFIFDLVAGLSKQGALVTLAIAGIHRFPLTEPLQRFCRIIDPLENALPTAGCISRPKASAPAATATNARPPALP